MIIPIFFAIDDNYSPFLKVTLTSLKENASKIHTYKIHVLYSTLSEENKAQLKQIQDKNFYIDFVDVTKRLSELNSTLQLRDYYSTATYYRIFISEMFPNYKKAIYLDSDIIVRGDISQLYSTRLGKNLVGAIVDEVVANTPIFIDYVENNLGVEGNKYFNAGVLVLNLDRIRKEHFFDKFNELLKQYKFVVAQDQDYLNVLCHNRVKYINSTWNKMPIPSVNNMPKLIHYNLTLKPWHYTGILYEEYFWEYVKKSGTTQFIKNCLDNYDESLKQRDKECEANLLNLAKKEAHDKNNYLNTIKKSAERQEVLKKIALYEQEGKFDIDVENDPPTIQLNPDKVDYLQQKWTSKIKRKLAYRLGNRFFSKFMKKGQIVVDEIKGVENLEILRQGGAVITCNHFAVYDNFIVFKAVQDYLKNGRLFKIIREGNYTSFKGLFGFLFRNCDTLPLSSNIKGKQKVLKAVDTILQRGDSILIYPEQAMWWNYRKPRPFKNGAFKMASRNNVPVIPIFITMRDSDKIGTDGYPIQIHTIHILKPVYPEKNQSSHTNAEIMRKLCFNEYRLKYEQVYRAEYDLC